MNKAGNASDGHEIAVMTPAKSTLRVHNVDVGEDVVLFESIKALMNDGYIEVVPLIDVDGTPDYTIDLIVDEEGKLKGLPMTMSYGRALSPHDILCGTVIAVGVEHDSYGEPTGEWVGLTQEQIEKVVHVYDSARVKVIKF